jgi:hypothetical protein
MRQVLKGSYGAGMFFIAGLVCFSGCNTEPPLPPLFPVKGTVKVGKELVTSGQITLIPVQAGGEGKVPPSSGQISESGEYEIFTGGKSGAPKGRYKVGVTPSMVPKEGAKGPPKAPYSDKYRNPQASGVEIDVTESPKAYDLTLTKSK